MDLYSPNGDINPLDVEPLLTSANQLPLFDLGDSAIDVLELFPAVWGAAEALTYADLAARSEGLRQIERLGAARMSLLVAYILATRIIEPDIELRRQVVHSLASIWLPDDAGRLAPDSVRNHLSGILSQMRTRQIFALLQVLDHDPAAESEVALLLNACSFAGVHLSSIMEDRDVPLRIRECAVRMITRVGYLDAVPTLERILARLEAKLKGQQAMPFAPREKSDELELLPAIQDALLVLNSP